MVAAPSTIRCRAVAIDEAIDSRGTTEGCRSSRCGSNHSRCGLGIWRAHDTEHSIGWLAGSIVHALKTISRLATKPMAMEVMIEGRRAGQQSSLQDRLVVPRVLIQPSPDIGVGQA